MPLHFIDIGARRGGTARLLMKSPKDVKAYLFEPNPALMEHLRQKFASEPRVALYECALTDHAGTATFYVPDSFSGSSSLYAEKRTSTGAGTITVQCMDVVEFIEGLGPGPIVLYSNCEGSEFEIVPAIIERGLHSRIVLWSVAFHHGDRKIPSMKPAYAKIERTMAELGIENVAGHFGKADIESGRLQEFVDRVLSLAPDAGPAY